MSIGYRSYRNCDTPALMTLWNQALTTRGCCLVPKPSVLEANIIAKPWFNFQAFTLAFDDETATTALPPGGGGLGGGLVGAALAGFGVANDAFRLDTQKGIISLVMVLPRYRRRKIGTTLLRHAEAYLAEKGTIEVQAGSSQDRSPYLWGMLGSSSPSGVLQSDHGAGAFLHAQGYHPQNRSVVLSRLLNRAIPMGDSRFPSLRRKYSLAYNPRRAANWSEEAVEGCQEAVVFELMETSVGRPVAQVRGWDMNLFAMRNKTAQAGLYGLHVKPAWRGQGLGKYLLCLVLQHLQEQMYGLVEAVVPDQNQKVQKLFDHLGFSQVDEGWTYTKRLR